MDSYRWAKYPMKERICELRKNLALTFIYGQLSWVDRNPAEFIKDKRVESSVDIHVRGYLILLCYYSVYKKESDS